MDYKAENIEEIVKKVLAGMIGDEPKAAPAPACGTPVSYGAKTAGIPEKAHVAVLVEKERFEVNEYPIPAEQTLMNSSAIPSDSSRSLSVTRALARSSGWARTSRTTRPESRFTSATRLSPA